MVPEYGIVPDHIRVVATLIPPLTQHPVEIVLADDPEILEGTFSYPDEHKGIQRITGVYITLPPNELYYRGVMVPYDPTDEQIIFTAEPIADAAADKGSLWFEGTRDMIRVERT